MNETFKHSLTIAFLLTAFNACKKEDALYDRNELNTFRFEDSQGDIQQAPIHGDTVYIYWPPLQALPDSIWPEYTLHETATAVPASGAGIAFNKPVTYRVQAQNGAERVYHVKFIINQPYPYISATKNILSANGNKFWVNDKQVTLEGDYYKTHEEDARVVAIDAQGQEQALTIVENTGAKLVVAPPALGVYQIQLRVGVRTVSLPDSVEVIMPFVTPALTAPAAALMLKPGETFTLSGELAQKITSVTLGDYLTQTPLDIVSATDAGIVLKLPADFPVGTYVRLVYVYSGDVYYNEGQASLSLFRTPLVVEQAE